MGIIAISGKKGSGKDTVGLILLLLSAGYTDTKRILESVEEIEEFGYTPKLEAGFEIKKFADTLKDIVCLILKCSREDLEDQEFKEKSLGSEWDVIVQHLPTGEKNLLPVTEDWNKSDGIVDYTFQSMTPRKMLQLMGTEAAKNIIHPNIWINSLMREHKKGDNWLITDLRFPGEVDAINKLSKEKEETVFLLRITRPSLNSTDEHISETALDNYQNFDLILENEGTKEELIEKVKQLNLH